ncbi:MAG TPA: polysaccharide deacetylase family protein [Polyangiaceae bacterium]|nr:polysaccharide deacetylase family protein [Polyangiaceae bacterium]
MPPARAALYASTAGILALAVRAGLGHPPPLGWAVLVLAGYVALLLAGVLVLRLRVFVDAVVRGPAGARGVALTFDDGPDPRWTPKVLECLAKRGVVATFFVIGRKAERHPDVVRAILAAGHGIGLHAHDHDRLFSLRSERRVRADLERGIAALEKVSGQRPVLFRPPIGHTNPAIGRVADDLGLAVVGWTVAGRDGLAGARPEDVVTRVRRELRDRVIVLLHDAAERGDREPAAVRALPAILDAIAAERLDVVPVAQWVQK